MQKITSNVYVETGNRGCNTSFVVTADGVVAIDTPMVPEAAKKWAAEIAKHGPLRYVINGEAHGDHISGNCYLGGILIAHEGTREAILNSDLTSYKQMLERLAPGIPLDKDFRYRAPDITLTDRLTIYLGKHTFRLMALPGHSPYQVTVYVPEERVVFTSDNVVTVMPFFRQALPDEWIKSLKYLQQLDFDKVVCGHGEVQDKAYLPQMIKNIQTWTGAVADAIKKGMTLEEAQKNVTMIKEFPDLARNQQMPGVIPMNVAALYGYLKNKAKP
ncbi:MAG: MBL fold metallo-hydrolase [Dehalococcoidales bacterium]|jgi:cyclase